MPTKPYYPIIYIRGYAGSQDEVEETVADPYMGFNLGAAKVRQLWTGQVRRYLFESPLLRLMKDHGYRDCYEAGNEIEDTKALPDRAVWIYRYYEPVSEDLGTGKRPEIEDYAKGLRDLIHKLRDRYCGDSAQLRAEFRVYLVAHSMGGLIARCFLQNPKISTEQDVAMVDKVFTYATPHGGIEFKLVGNVPSFITANNIDNFNHPRMRKYLALGENEDPRTLKRFDSERFFCLIGTNFRDYTVAGGLSRDAVGEMSDGLVRIVNAYVTGSPPRAFVYRSHSGHYGIVNSESGYQNLRRFLFGDAKVEVYLDIEALTLPSRLQKEHDEGKQVRASYHIETVFRVRSSDWDLHRRVFDEASAILGKFDDLVKAKRRVRLGTVFLLDGARARRQRPSLGYSVELKIRIPEYTVDNKWWFDDHYSGSYIFVDKFNLELTPAQDGAFKLRWGSDRTSTEKNTSTRLLDLESTDDGVFRAAIPVVSKSRPGVTGQLVFEATRWNA